MSDLSSPPPVLRVARPTDDIGALRQFYLDGLGFDVLAEFQDHDGFDGLVVGHPHAPYHLEFTRHPDHPAGHAPGPEHLLVFYLPGRTAWDTAVARMTAAGFAAVPAQNPYWDRRGLTFADPDGYRCVLQNAGWAV